MRHAFGFALVALVGLLGVGTYHLGDPMAWANWVHAVTTVGLLGCIAGVWLSMRQARPQLALWVVTCLMAIHTVFVAASIVGSTTLAIAPYGRGAYAVALMVASVIATVGMWRKQLWARWMIIGLGLASLLGGAMNAANFWTAAGTVNHQYFAWWQNVARSEWAYQMGALGGAVLALAAVAAGPLMTKPNVWQSTDRTVQWLRLGMVAALTAVPNLIVYFAVQPVVSTTRWSALAVAGLLSVAAMYLHKGKTLGALLLGIAGAALLAQAAVSIASASSIRVVLYYCAFWLPAGVVAIGGALAVVPALWRANRL